MGQSDMVFIVKELIVSSERQPNKESISAWLIGSGHCGDILANEQC